MGLMDRIRETVITWLRSDEYSDTPLRKRVENYLLWSSYYQGEYRKQLRIKNNQADDNLGLNFVGLVVDRGVSLLLGNGLEFDMGDDETTQEYIDEVYDANKSGILLHKACQLAAIYGTGFIKIIPDGVATHSSENDIVLPRLVVLDPLWVQIETLPEDMETVVSYNIRYNVRTDEGDVARWEKTYRELDEDGGLAGTWRIVNYRSAKDTQGRWVIMSESEWPYEFPPIIHWQNLPQPDSVYGQSDVEDIIELQDRINFVASNISKVIRYHAHPKTWGRNAASPSKMSWGADELLMFNGDSAMLDNLEMQSDLASSRAFLTDLRQSLFDISRTVDITSITDRIGSLTNFGLRVLFMDALAKIGTKQELFGEALEELNHRLLSIAGISHEDGGEVMFPETLPINKKETSEALEKDINLELVSKETASGLSGYDYDKERERINNEKAENENIGSMLLGSFNRGQGNIGIEPVPGVTTENNIFGGTE